MASDISLPAQLNLEISYDSGRRLVHLDLQLRTLLAKLAEQFAAFLPTQPSHSSAHARPIGAILVGDLLGPKANLSLDLTDTGLDDAGLAVLPGLGARMDGMIAEGEGERDVAVLARDSLNAGKTGK